MAKRILVADENRNVLRRVKVILGEDGYEVALASSLGELKERISEIAPHVVLLDAELPPEDGYRACQLLKDAEGTSDMVVLLMVGTFVPLDRDALSASHADGFITKPFDPLALKARIREIYQELSDTHRILAEDVARATERAAESMASAESPSESAREASQETSQEILAEVEALSQVPELEAGDIGEIVDQDQVFPADESEISSHEPPADEAEAEVPSPETVESPLSTESAGEPVPEGEATARIAALVEEEEATREHSTLSQDDSGATPRLVAFVQRLKQHPEADDGLSDEERRIIQDNEAVLREVADAGQLEKVPEEEGLKSLAEDVEELSVVKEEGDEGSRPASEEDVDLELVPPALDEESDDEEEAPRVAEEVPEAAQDAALEEAEIASGPWEMPEEEEAESLGDDSESEAGDEGALDTAEHALEPVDQAVVEHPETDMGAEPLDSEEESKEQAEGDRVASEEPPPALEVVESTQAVENEEAAAPDEATDSSEGSSQAESEEPEGLVAVADAAAGGAEAASDSMHGSLDRATFDLIVRAVVERISAEVVREIAWDVVPELAELLIKEKLLDTGSTD